MQEDKAVKMRLLYMGCMILAFLLIIPGIIFKFQIMIILGFILAAIFLCLYFYDHLFVHSDYHVEDFGNFSTKIHNAFNGEWEESADDSLSEAFGCKVKKFTTTVDTGERKYDMSYRRGAELHTKYEKMPTTGHLEITYMKFDTPEECKSNEKKIKERFTYGFINTYSSNNVFIVFHCYVVGFSHATNQNIYYSQDLFYNLKSVQLYTITRNASKNVVLK